MKLIYQGTNKAHITGVPARDLEDSDIEKAAALFGVSRDEAIALLTLRGLYLEDKPKKQYKKFASDEALEGESEV